MSGSATGAIPVERVISMSELQKLSLKKLRALRLSETPLVVSDLKRHARRFVILDHRAYEDLRRGAGGPKAHPTRAWDLDFASHGLFWDRPTLTNERFSAMLRDPDDPEYGWAWARVLERIPSRLVTRAIGLDELRRLVPTLKLRPRTRAAWEGALEFWTAETRRRLA